MTSLSDRRQILMLVEKATGSGASLEGCARVLGLSARTLKRWEKGLQEGCGDRRPIAIRPTPANALTEQEQAEIIEVMNSPEFASLPPSQVVPILADEGRYIGSESSCYRVMHKHKQVRHRGRARTPRRVAPKPTHVASRPNQVWVWDITWLPSPVAGRFYKLYAIMDLYSRKIIAEEVWEEENSDHSKEILRRAYLKENIGELKTPLILHGDNGSSLKAQTVQTLMYQLGIASSYSRPRVSNDNPHVEALFRTAKYHPSLPPGSFTSIEAARQWAQSFTRWYNQEHHHSALRFVTPNQKHTGEDRKILHHRHLVYKRAQQQHPRRWIQKKPRNWSPIETTALNPIDLREIEKHLKKIA